MTHAAQARQAEKRNLEQHKRRANTDGSHPANTFELHIRREALIFAYLRGTSGMDSSPMGAMADRVEPFGHTSWWCPRCRGNGVLRPKEARKSESDNLLELLTDDQPRPPPKLSPACRFDELLKVDRETVLALVGKTGRTQEAVLLIYEPWCPSCEGTGYRSSPMGRGQPPTARPTGSSKTPWRNHDERLSSLLGYGMASRVLRTVERQSSEYPAALIAYFGSVGERWASSKYGRAFAVYPLTRSGEKLLARTRDLAGELSPWERIWSTVIAPTNNEAVAALTDAAGVQAMVLLERAGRAWNDAIATHWGEVLETAEVTP